MSLCPTLQGKAGAFAGGGTLCRTRKTKPFHLVNRKSHVIDITYENGMSGAPDILLSGG
jgi:hypothetical protein